MRTKKLLFWSLGLICLLSGFVVLTKPFNNSSPRFNGVTSAGQMQLELQEMLARAEPSSTAAAEIQAALNKLAAKQSKDRIKAENPGALIEAMADIKTGADGQTYPVGYRVAERLKARARKHAGDAVAGAPLPWTERGPGNISGRARAIVVDAADPGGNSWFIASVGGGIWYTTDQGQNWADLTPDLPNLSTSSLEQSQSNPDILYAGTGMGFGRVVDLAGSGIWKSTDHGQTWQQLASTADGQLFSAINRIVVDPANPDVVLVCGNDSRAHQYAKPPAAKRSGIYKSTDGGESWTLVFDPEGVLPANTDNRVQQIIYDPTDFNKLYAAVNEVGVIRSVDAGETWTVSADNFALPADIGLPTDGGFGLAGISVRTELAISPTDPNRLYAAVERPRGIADLFMTTDAGDTWVELPDTGADPNWFNAFGQSGAVQGAYTAGWFDNTIVVHPFDPNVVFVGGVNIYRIDVDPENLNRLAAPLTWWLVNNSGLGRVHSDQHDLVTIPNAANQTFRIVVANDGGVGYSQDGGTNWVHLVGMGTSQFYGADKKPGDDAYIGGLQDNGSVYSPSNPTAATPWNPAGGGDGFEVAWNKRDPNLLLATSQFNIFHRSSDGGQNWLRIVPGANVRSSFITKVAQSRMDPDLVFSLNANGILRSDDFGLTWSQTAIQGRWLGYRPFCNVEASQADARIVWASSKVTIDVPSNRAGGVHVSTDGGSRFEEVTHNIPDGYIEASGIATHPDDPGTAYLLYSAPRQGKILRTTDFGSNWEDFSSFVDGVSTTGFPDVAVFDLLVMPFDPQIMWAATEIGLFVTSDGGASWEYSDNGLPAVSIFQLNVVDNEVVAATYGRGIWSTELSQLNDYVVPQPPLMPRISKLSVSPGGMLTVSVDQRSAYDSTRIFRNGFLIGTLEANAEPTSYHFESPVEKEGVVTIYAQSFVDGQIYRSPDRQIFIWAPEEVVSYSTDLNDSTDAADFRMFGWSVATPPGFNDHAFHTPHPYPNASNIVLWPHFAIRVAQDNATLEYDEVVLVEEGTADDWQDPLFFDFALVEGSSDGCNWVPLIPGYDSRAYPSASASYRAGLDGGGNSTTPGSVALFERRVINLQETFNPGDLIFIRFRLGTDAAANAWGWAIDNLDVQPNATSVHGREADLSAGAAIAGVYPHPATSEARIELEIERADHVTVDLLDLRGQFVATLFNGELPAGMFNIPLSDAVPALDNSAGGVYMLRLQTRTSTQTTSILLLR